MQVEFQTDVGRKRTNNQDTVGVYINQEDIVIGVIADGMGGHQAGDAASRFLVNGIGSSWEQTTLVSKDKIAKWLVDEIQRENERIFSEGNNNPDKFGMGTTVVAAVALSDQVLVAHVGDSRCYIIRGEKIQQLTSDHSLVNELVKKGELTPEMAAIHPKKNVLVRSVGVPGEVETDLSLVSIQAGDYILLCSDGLSNMLSNKEIQQIIQPEAPIQEKVTQLIQKANEAGGRDNISVVLMDFHSLVKVGDGQ